MISSMLESGYNTTYISATAYSVTHGVLGGEQRKEGEGG